MLSTNRGLPIFSIRHGLLLAHSGLDALLAKGTCAPHWLVHTGELHARLTARTSSVGAERNVSEGSLTRSASCRRMAAICAYRTTGIDGFVARTIARSCLTDKMAHDDLVFPANSSRLQSSGTPLALLSLAPVRATRPAN